MANKIRRSGSHPSPSKVTVFGRKKAPLLLGLALLFCIAGVEPAFAEPIRAPRWTPSEVEWAAGNFWPFFLFIACVPLNSLIFGVLVTIGGAFIPVYLRGKTAETGTVEISLTKLLFKGAPRYAVCLVGILIVAWALNGHASGRTAGCLSSQTKAASPPASSSERTMPGPREQSGKVVT
jgi:hypothetical protein